MIVSDVSMNASRYSAPGYRDRAGTRDQRQLLFPEYCQTETQLFPHWEAGFLP
jgi:hypothetical protein